MNMQTVLDHVIFQLTPTRTRYELFVVADGVAERVTSGLLKPFLLHLKAAEEQLEKGGYSIKLESPVHREASWFTKGTAERFVRFVSSPEVLERGNTIEMELVQLEETIKMQTLSSSRVEDPFLDDSSSISVLGEKSLSPFGKPRLLKKMRHDSADVDSGVSTNSKKQLLRALEARRLVLQKEQGMAFARAAAAGFELVHLLQLIMFAECFGAARLREACCNFVVLCQKAQITGFCMGDLYLIDQDVSWALSNTYCVNILKSMERALPSKEKSKENTVLSKIVADISLQKDCSLSDGIEHPSIERREQQQLPSSQSQVCEWSHSADVYQGWPAMYTDRNGPCATFYGYQYGYSPGSQESFTTLSDMSPSATGLFCYSPGVASQQPFKAQANFQTPSQDMNSFPSLKKLQLGHKRMKKSRMASQAIKSEESFTHEKDSSEVTDSSPERSASSKAASVVLRGDCDSRVSVKNGQRQGLLTNTEIKKSWTKVAVREVEVGLEINRRSDSSELSDSTAETVVPSFRAMTSTNASITLMQNKDASSLDRSFAQHQTYEVTSNVKKSHRTVSDDNSLISFEKCMEGARGSRPKKRLDFHEPETRHKQEHAEGVKSIDDSFFVCSPPVNCEHRSKSAIESELQGHQIYDKMSKQALKVNSVISCRRDPDDLLMLRRSHHRNSSRNSSDVLNIDIELRGAAEHTSHFNSQKPLTGSQLSQERVKKFLDQYNEKREAKLRGDVSSSKRAEREGKLKALKEDLDKTKSDLVRAGRPGRASLQAEAQLRAEKLRMYKADLQKSKKEKEEEERRRLEALKAQRQERIAARSNLTGRSNANSCNANSCNSRGQMSSPFSSKPIPAANRLSAVQKRTSLRDSQGSASFTQMTRHSREHALTRTSPKPVVRQPRSSTPSLPRQTGRASIGSQPSMKAETLKGPQRTTSPPVRTNRVFSAVFGKDTQMGRSSLTRKMENSTIASKKQGFLPGSCSGFPLERRKKGPPPKAGKEMPKSVDETKREGITFLKKGSGAGSSSRSTHAATAVDKRPHFMSGSRASKVDLKQRSKGKVSGGDAGVATSRSTTVKSNSSTQAPMSTRMTSKSKLEMDLTQLGRKEASQVKDSDALMHLDCEPSTWDADGTATQSNSIHWPGACSILQKNHMNSEGATLKGPLLDSDMSQLMLFDRSCTTNRDLNMHSTDSQGLYLTSTVSGVVSPQPQSTSSTDSPQTSCKQQSNGLKKPSSLGQMSMPIMAPTMSEDHQAANRAREGERFADNAFPFNRLKELSQTSKIPITAAAYSQENHSSNSKGSTTKVSRPFSFSGTLRSKAAEEKWQ